MEHSENTCLVCHEAVEVYAIGSCDHPICFKCSTRMRSLCEQLYCPICRTDLPEVFFMFKKEKFGEMPIRKFIANRKLKIQFENEAVRHKFDELLEHRCYRCTDSVPERSFKALQDHMRRKHTLFFCTLCLELKIFSRERKVYNRTELAAHRRVGDKDDTSYKGHPLCQFCDERYLDKDELYKHLRKDHYFCHFCESQGSQEFFCDYHDLKDHFGKEHFLCEEGDCVDAQFENAFRSDIDMKSHKALHHSKAQSKHQSRQERTINIDINFVPRPNNRGRGVVSRNDYEEVRGGAPRHQGGRGGSRNQDDRGGREGAHNQDDRDSRGGARNVDNRGGREGAHQEDRMGRGGARTQADRGGRGGARNQDARSGGPPRHQGGRGGRPRSERESQDVERAIQNSLSTMSDDVMKKKKAKVTESSSEDEFTQTVNNFPTLSGETQSKTPVSSTATSISENSKSSLADRCAISNNMSVQHGVLGLNDFPTLNQSAKTNDSINIPRSSTGRNSPFNAAVSHKKMEEDFPGLPTSNKPIAQAKQTWVKSGSATTQGSSQAKKVVSISNTTKPSRPVSSVSSNQPKAASSSKNKMIYNDMIESDFPSLGGSYESVAPSNSSKMKFIESKPSAPISNNKMKYIESDFPGLGGPAKPTKPAINANWFDGQQVNTNGNNNHKSVEAESSVTSDNFDIKDRYSPVNIPNSPKNEQKAKSKKKKKKEKIENPSKNLVKNEGLKGNSSLDDIASLLLSSKIADQPEKDTKSKQKNEKVPSASVTVNSEPTPSAKFEKVKERKKIDKIEKQMLGQSEEVVKDRPKEEQSAVKFYVAQEEFPSLGAPAKAPKKPPPGFKKDKEPAVVKSPPGFAKTASNMPPPGFVSQIENMSVKTEPKSTNKYIVNTPYLSNQTNFEYAQPEGFSDRNRALIGLVQAYCSGDPTKFPDFKSLSGEFRRSDTTAKHYYERCEEILGKDNFADMFPELMALLPDINKQQDLLTVYIMSEGLKKDDNTNKVLKISGKTRNAKGAWIESQSGFLTCQTCRQVLVRRDYNKHVNLHNLDSDFPSL